MNATCLYLVERQEIIRDGGLVYTDVSTRCAWDIPLSACATCPARRLVDALPAGTEIAQVRYERAECLACPDRDAACPEYCVRDTSESDSDRGAFVIVIEEVHERANACL